MGAGDRERLAEILAEPSIRRWWGTKPPDVDAAELVTPGGLRWAIEVDGRLVGGIEATEEDEPDYRHAALDLFLDADHQGIGLGPEAIRLVARHLFEERGHHRLTIDPALANERAIGAYERVGFRSVGVMRRYERGSDGTWHDGLLMDMLAGELADDDVADGHRPRRRPGDDGPAEGPADGSGDGSGVRE
jgi:aminoglycoside 6'-N-acetyltransferase